MSRLAQLLPNHMLAAQLPLDLEDQNPFSLNLTMPYIGPLSSR
jgi:hypothetical protein